MDMPYESESESGFTNEDLAGLITGLDLQEPMSIEEFLDPLEENQIDAILTDEELLEAAQTQEEDKEQDEMEQMSGLTECFSYKEQIRAFTIVKSVLEDRENLESEEIRSILQRLKWTQSEIREEARKEMELHIIQPSITDYFHRS